MRRITRRVRPVVSKGQLEHYIYGSEKHLRDKEVAIQLRSMEFVPLTTVAEPKPPFPRAHEVAENLVREGDKWMAVEGQEYIKRLLPFTGRKAGTYWAPRVVKGEVLRSKKTGQDLMIKQHTRALHDVYLSLPPWVTEVFADAMALSDSVGTIRNVAEQAALAAAEVLEKRTGYKVLGIALHPDSKQAFGIHIQYLSVEGGKLLGRSATGGKGRRGLRLAGDVNCALHRFNKVKEIPGRWQDVVARRDYDDIAMIDAMDQTIKEMVPRADSTKESYVNNWLTKRSKSRGEVDQEVDLLRLKVKSLEDENERLKGMLSMTTLIKEDKAVGDKRGVERILPSSSPSSPSSNAGTGSGDTPRSPRID
jgi:hypothetical protein